MNQKEPTKTFMMISSLIKPFGLHGLNENYSELQVAYLFIRCQPEQDHEGFKRTYTVTP